MSSFQTMPEMWRQMRTIATKLKLAQSLRGLQQLTYEEPFHEDQSVDRRQHKIQSHRTSWKGNHFLWCSSIFQQTVLTKEQKFYRNFKILSVTSLPYCTQESRYIKSCTLLWVVYSSAYEYTKWGLSDPANRSQSSLMQLVVSLKSLTVTLFLLGKKSCHHP